jgi:uncharacterized protein YdbL (DUF1318 family)
MDNAKRRIKKFDFSAEGAHCALVDKAANAQTVLVMKAATATLTVPVMEFLTRYVGLWYDDAEMLAGMMGLTKEDIIREDYPETWEEAVQENLDKVTLQKSEQAGRIKETFEDYLSKRSKQALETTSEEAVSSTKEGAEEINVEDNSSVTNEVTKMTDKTELTLEEQIQKAANSIVESRVEELEKAYTAKAEAVQKELDILKAAEEARTEHLYLAKADKLAVHLGEEADKPAIAKAFRKAEADEELNVLVKALEKMSEMKAQEPVLEEIGKSATSEQEMDDEATIESISKKLQKEEGLSSSAAYVKAFEQVHGE